MKSNNHTPNLRALALTVTLLSAITATLLVTHVSLISSADMAGYGVDEPTKQLAQGYSR